MSTAVDDLRERMLARYEAVATLAADIAVEETRGNIQRTLLGGSTGALEESVTHTPVSAGPTFTCEISATASYAEFQDRGTGIYGPYGTPIVPKVKTFLKFDDYGATIFARSVKGSPPKQFFAEPMPSRWANAVASAASAVAL